MKDGCPFCEYAGPSTAKSYRLVYVIEPLNPVVPGHLLVIPYAHVASAVAHPYFAGVTMEEAARIARDMGPVNFITSVGREATQTIDHLHIHVIPRQDGDGLRLPWPDPGESG